MWSDTFLNIWLFEREKNGWRKFLFISVKYSTCNHWEENFHFCSNPIYFPYLYDLWSYRSWIYNYLCNWCPLPVMLWVRLPLRAMCTTLCDKICQWLPAGRWLSPGPSVSSTNKTDRHNITEILLKVTLDTMHQPIYCLTSNWLVGFIIFCFYGSFFMYFWTVIPL